MDLWRQNFWLLVVVGMIFVSGVISFIFILINKCISRRGKHSFIPLQRRSDSKLKSNKYQERNFISSTPALPPRTQFLLAEAQSYENLAEGPEDEDSLGNYEECVDPPPDCGNTKDGTELYCEPDPKTKSGPAAGESEEHDYEESTDQLDYVKVDDGIDTTAPPSQNTSDLKMMSQVCLQSYENLNEEHDYEESTDQLDYVKVDDEEDTAASPSQNTSDLKLQSQVCLQSYENLSEEHDYEESTDQLDYVKVDDETDSSAPPSQNTSDLKMMSQVCPGQSYENLSEEHDYEESTDQLDYVKVDDGIDTTAPPSQNTSDLKLLSQVCPGQSYENLSEEPDYEQSIDDQLDYVKVEENPFPQPPDPAAEDSSSDDYDDIGDTSDGKEEEEEEDDYDDVA